MTISSYMLRNVLSDRSAYCCLCFNSIGEIETPYNIEDEVLLDIDIEGTKVMYEIISTVLGDKAVNTITAHNMICQKCTQIVINSYKFIQKCSHNIEQLDCIIKTLEQHTQDISREDHDFKSLFVALDTSNYNVKLYYDKYRNCNNQTILHKRFQRLEKDAQELYLEIELESNNYVARRKKKHRRILQSPELAYHDKDEVNNLECKRCLKLYSTATKLKQHYLRVHGPKDFKCSQCPRSFGSLLLLKRHTKDSHCNVVCSQCGKTYTNIYSLRHHERSHKLRLVCQTCGKIYKGKQAFKNHIENKLCEKMRKSNSEAKLTCDYCGKKYSQKSALSVHIRLKHENGKALICDWCGKKVSSMSRLKDHIIKHTKQKNFECKRCGGKFVTKTSLLYHTRTHTGEKPYKCEHCDMTFLSASRRSEHVKRHHTQLNVECDICHGKFKGNTCLLRHRRKHFDVSSRLYHNPQT